MFPCEFLEIFKNDFFHRTPPVAASENLKAEAAFRGCSIKEGVKFRKIHSKTPVPESLFYSLRPVTLLK